MTKTSYANDHYSTKIELTFGINIISCSSVGKRSWTQEKMSEFNIKWCICFFVLCILVILIHPSVSIENEFADDDSLLSLVQDSEESLVAQADVEAAAAPTKKGTPMPMLATTIKGKPTTPTSPTKIAPNAPLLNSSLIDCNRVPNNLSSVVSFLSSFEGI